MIVCFVDGGKIEMGQNEHH